MPKEIGHGIAVRRITSSSIIFDDELTDSHRHDHHTFVLQERGSSLTEIDFQEQLINKPSIFYQSPNQVHRAIKIEDIELYVMVINTEYILTAYRKQLQQLSPAKPLTINGTDLDMFRQTFFLCEKLSHYAQQQFYSDVLEQSCNALIGLFVAHYLKSSKPADRYSRFEIIQKAFAELLENHFTSLKRPSDYAQMLHISVPYLNECIHQVTGFSVSRQIHQRIMLEAKRLLYHSDRSIKQIATELGYSDHAYFSRLFTKTTGINAKQFRSKNLD